MSTKAQREAWLMKLAIGVVTAVIVASILGGVGLSVGYGNLRSDAEAGHERDDRQDERADRVEERNTEALRGIDVKLMELRNLFHKWVLERDKK